MAMMAQGLWGRQLQRLVVLLVTLAVWTPAAQAQRFVEREFRDDDGVHKYQVFVPAGYSANRPLPTILFLHGAGECGTDGRKPTLVGLGPCVKAWGEKFPYLAVFPQVETTRGRMLTRWAAGSPDAERALKILDEVQSQFAVDREKISLVGWSMGGYGAWSLGAAHPERWAGVMPISGGGDPETVATLKDTPVWAFHGARDTIVPASGSQEMVAALKAAGGRVTYNEFPSAGHELFRETFLNSGVIAWLGDPANRPAELAARPTELVIEPPPFVPVLDIPNAVGIRMGNEFLDALSYAAPQMIPASMLTGRLNDMFDSTSAQGRSFSVRFSGISYSGQLERVRIQATGNDRVTVQLGLRNITLSIGGTSVTGARQSAYAGPIGIYIGHNRPVWLTIDVAPYVADRQLKLRLLGSSFSIPADSYSVSQPAGVSVQGLGMTRERVVSGLTSGLYGARYRVENEVRAIVPGVVQELERQLTLTDPGPIVAGMWPLPVYSPRLRAFPQRVVSDAQGISVVMGLTAADFDLAAVPKPVRTAADAGVTADQLTGTSLGVAVAPGIMEPLSQLLVDADLVQIDLRDLPEPAFHRLAERAVLAEILPDLKRFGDDVAVRAELMFDAAMQVGVSATDTTGTATDTSTDAAALSLAFPQSVVLVSIQTPESGQRWQPYARFDLAIADRVQAELARPSHTVRQLELAWQDEGQITGSGQFVDGVTPQDSRIDSDRFLSLFRESWQNWTRQAANSATTIPDVTFAQTRLRIDGLAARRGTLKATFDIPTIKLTNLSEEPFLYQTRGPYSAWSETYTLAPGRSQEYKIPYPLVYRRSGPGTAETYSLFTGTHSEYRVPRTGGSPRLFEARPPQD